MIRPFLIVSAFVIAVAQPAAPQIPRLINYQGVLAGAGGVVVADGAYDLTFRIYDVPSHGSALWEDTIRVNVSKGIFNAILGSEVPLTGLLFDTPYYIGISVSGGPELPRQAITASAYSLSAQAVKGAANVFPSSGNVGIGVPNPVETIDIAGGIRLGGSTRTNPGTIRWTGSDFEGYDGGAWKSFTDTGAGLPSGTLGETLRHSGLGGWVASGLLYNDGKSIGIGTKTPARLLDVAGNVNVSDSLSVGYAEVGTVAAPGEMRVTGEGGTNVLAEAYVYGGRVVLYDDAAHQTVGILPDVSTGGGGYLSIERSETGGNALVVDGNYFGTEEPRVSITGSTKSASFRMDQEGNGSVVLPADAISASETLDETGIASYTSWIGHPLDYNVINKIGFRSINVPAAGYVFAIASCGMVIDHLNGYDNFSSFGVSADTLAIPQTQGITVGIPSGLPTGYYRIPITVQGVFEVPSAGLYTYYFIAKPLDFEFNCGLIQFTLIYLPTAYGLVSTTAAQSASGGGAFASAANEVTAERAQSAAFNAARMQKELLEMRAEIEALKAEAGNE